MEAIISAYQSSRAVDRPRVDGSAPASSKREKHVENAGVDQALKQPDAKTVERAAERLDTALQQFQRDLSISVHQDTGQMVVRVTDLDGNVIRQIPPEQLLEAEVSIDKMIGLLIDDHA